MYFSFKKEKDNDKNTNHLIKDKIINTQTTNVQTELNEVSKPEQASCFKNNNYIITDSNENNVLSRNKEFKKSMTSCNPIPIIMKTSTFSIHSHNNNTSNNMKFYNKMNTRVSLTNRNDMFHLIIILENKEIKTYQSKQTMNKRGSFFNRLSDPIVINPLEVQEEDKIFNVLNQESDIVNNKIQRPFTQDKALFNPHKRILDRLYHFPLNYIKELEKAKKQKSTLSLERYQNNLLEAVGDNISRENKQRLEKKFYQLRVECLQSKVRQDVISLEEIEEKEKAIINYTNMCDKYCEEMLRTAGNGFRKTKFILPEIKFESVIVSKDA